MWARMNIWIKLHTRLFSSLHNSERTYLDCKKQYKIFLIKYKMINIQMKFQVIIDVNVSTKSNIGP
jgi:hypothetical protein